ncbi:hypothetical protein, partial [Alistipes ihumii]|uniref:hypothetical protein n=1 Tax=Alistipes ihumii TaxID=1470347 RepID=UPI00265CE29A
MDGFCAISHIVVYRSFLFICAAERSVGSAVFALSNEAEKTRNASSRFPKRSAVRAYRLVGAQSFLRTRLPCERVGRFSFSTLRCGRHRNVDP